MPKIVLDRVEKRYGAVCVLRPLDLTPEDGEFPVLVGLSGCGKVTTMRMIAGLESLSAGEIRFDGRPISALEPKARDIAMVFQDNALHPHMNIAQRGGRGLPHPDELMTDGARCARCFWAARCAG